VQRIASCHATQIHWLRQGFFTGLALTSEHFCQTATIPHQMNLPRRTALTAPWCPLCSITAQAWADQKQALPFARALE